MAELSEKWPDGWSALGAAAAGAAFGLALIWLGGRMQAGWVQTAGIAFFLDMPPGMLGAYILGKVTSNMVRCVLCFLAAAAIFLLAITTGPTLKGQNLPDQTRQGIAIAAVSLVILALKAFARFGEVELKRRKHGKQAAS